MSKRLVPFSKEKINDTTVSNEEGFLRSGFTDHVRIAVTGRIEPNALIKGKDMSEWGAGREGGHSHHEGSENVPSFKAEGRGAGFPAVPAPFSRKHLSEGPRKPYTPA